MKEKLSIFHTSSFLSEFSHYTNEKTYNIFITFAFYQKKRKVILNPRRNQTLIIFVFQFEELLSGLY